VQVGLACTAVNTVLLVDFSGGTRSRYPYSFIFIVYHF